MVDVTQRGADVLVKCLVAAGTRRVFALSGNHIMSIYDAALDAELDLVHVRHEAAAVHMADAWARITGSVGIALVTAGPGHANAVGALFTALQADSPVVLLSGHAPLSEVGRGSFQEMRQADVAAPVTKASWTVRSPKSLRSDLETAIATARSGKPGPVHLSLPSDVLDDVVVGDDGLGATLPSPVAMSPEQEAATLQALAASHRPLLICGPQFASRRARDALKRFEGTSGVPTLIMESPRGINDPALGLLRNVLANADTAILLGKQLDFTLAFGRAFGNACTIVEVPRDVEAMRVLAQLAKFTSGDRAWLDEVRDALAFRPAGWSLLKSTSSGPLHPVELCRGVQSALNSCNDAVFVSDGGEIGQWAQACIDAPHRIVNGVAGAIGPAIPFAVAAKMAKPESIVIAIVGDGTAGFHIAELDTAIRHRAAIVVVIGNDSTWNAEHQIQLRRFGKDRTHGLGLQDRTRYDKIAQALGCHGEFVTRANDLPAALDRAVRSGKPACVNVMIERVSAPLYARE
jgi:acetolactate synthase-1/2/3 large subunit